MAPTVASVVYSQNLNMPVMAEVVCEEKMDVSLKADQKRHAAKLLGILGEYKRCIDSSTTGAGKTYVAGFIARTLLNEGKIDNVHVICPPSLIRNWKTVLKLWHVPITFIHGYNKLHYPKSENTLLILDEFHFLKNVSQRYFRVRNLAYVSTYIHATSATPIDNSWQYTHLTTMFQVDIKLIQCRLVFKPLVPQEIKIIPDKEKVDKRITRYNNGYALIKQAGGARGESGQLTYFKGDVYTEGLYTIHSSMYSHLVNLIREELKQPNRKVIVIEHFKKIVSALTEEFANFRPLLLNGSTRQEERNRVVSAFQVANCEKRLLITSAVVGGVGLSLDDQQGNFPRTTIMMPLGNYIDYKQTLGRTHRRNTKSASKVIIVQPHLDVSETYMMRVVKKKGDTLDEYLDKSI